MEVATAPNITPHSRSLVPRVTKKAALTNKLLFVTTYTAELQPY